MNVQLGLRGEYRFVAQRPDGSIRAETDWIKNLITDAGMDAIGRSNSQDILQSCSVGTGNTAPTTADTALVAPVMNTTSYNFSGWSVGPAPTYDHRLVFVFTFAAATANLNLGEVGVFVSYNPGTALFSRALIVDSGGNPTTFTVLTGEILVVQYRVTVVQTDAVATYVVNVNGSGTPTTITMKRSDASGIAYRLPAPRWAASIYCALGGVGSSLSSTIAGTPSFAGFNTSATGASAAAYTNGTYYADVHLTWTISSVTAPVAIARLGISGEWYWQCSFSPPIDKNADRTLRLVFRISWARA